MTATKSPAFQFYPGDWIRDLALRSCSLTARGLWVELICIAWDGTPRGYCRVGGRALTVEEIARLVGERPRLVKELVAELIRFGVASQDEDGALFSRRMVRDEAVRQARASGGYLGGNPALIGNRAVENGSAKVNHKVGMKDGHELGQKDNQAPNLPPTPSSASSSASATAIGVGVGDNPPTPLPDGSRLSALGGGVDPGSVPPSPDPAPKPKATAAKAATWRDVPIPAVLKTPEFAAAWQEWHDYRRESKYRTWSARTASGSLSDLAALGVKVAVASIGKAISSGWQGIHPKAESAGSPRNLPPVGVAVLPSSDADRRDGACRYNGAAKHMERWSADRRVWEPLSAPAVPPPTAAASTTTTTATGAN